MKVKLSDVCEKASSNLRQSDVEGKTGQYPVYGAAGYIGNVDFYQQEKPYVAVVKDGAGIGRTMLLPAKSSVIGTMQYLLPKENVLPEYLCYVVQHMRLEKYFSGSTIPHIYFKDYQKETFNCASIEEQEHVNAILGKVEKVIEAHKRQIALLDDLVKSQFIEMFSSNNRYGLRLLSDVAEIIAGGDKPHEHSENKTEEYSYPVYANGIDNEGLQCFSKNYRVGRKAVTISARGTIGATFIREPFFTPIVRLITVIPNENVINVTYLKHAIEAICISGTGTSQQQLTVPSIKAEKIPVPPLTLQMGFEHFVHQSEKSKYAIQRSTEKLEMLKQALMQKYFG